MNCYCPSFSQFKSIGLLNVERIIFFLVVAKHMTSYLLANNYINISCQKADIPEFPGCVEHLAVIWDQIQTAKRNKSDQHVEWFDFANANRSFAYQFIAFTLKCFHVPLYIRTLVANYFNNFHI